MATTDPWLDVSPASGPEFAPFGRILDAGAASLSLGGRAGVVVHVAQREPGPHRHERLRRYLGARRLLVPLRPTPLVLVVLQPEGRDPRAFQTTGGQGVALSPGIWHGEPIPLAATPVLEILETEDFVDRVEVETVRALLGRSALLVRVSADRPAPTPPPAPAAPPPAAPQPSPPDLHVEIRLAPSAPLRLGWLELDALPGGGPSARLADHLRAIGRSLRRDRARGAAPTPEERATRDLAEVLGEAYSGSPFDQMLRALGRREPRLPRTGVECAVWRAAHETASHLSVYGLRNLREPLVVERGRRGQRAARDPRGALPLGGRIVLRDGVGAFGTFGPRLARGHLRPDDARALVVAWLPADLSARDAHALLDRVAAGVTRDGGGRGGRRGSKSQGDAEVLSG